LELTGIRGIADKAFAGCSNLASVAIDDSLGSIGGSAFRDCSGLTSVTIGNGVTDIGGSAFAYCTGLTNIIIPDSVTSIGGEAFYNCRGLTSVTIGNGVTNIGRWAFSGCWLASVTIFGNVTNDWTYRDPPFCSSTLATVILGGKMTKIGDYMFYGCSGLTSVTIPDSVTSIGWNAFSGCSGLTSVTIGNSVTNIRSYAFSGCKGLATMYVPASWEGGAQWTTMLKNASVPSGCQIIYGTPSPATETSSTPVAVPYGWLDGKAASFVAANGGDYEAAAKAKAANGVNTVWECYVAGLDPENAGREFTAELSIVDGKPVVSSEPEGVEGRTYTVEAKKDLSDEAEEWTDVTDNPAPEADGYRFFRVGVSLPE
jgi:hypothetical protein